MTAIRMPTRADAGFFAGHRRWLIVGLLFLVALVNNLDRQTLSVLAPTLREELGFGAERYSYIVSAFLATYTLGYLFAGRVLDRIGVKVGMALALGFWSLCAMLHAAATGWIMLASFRFLLGIGESFNSPAGVKAISEWIPPRERGLSMAVFSNGNVAGAILAPPLVAFVALHFGWRWAFGITGGAGLVLLWVWWRQYETPARHPRLGNAERDYLARSMPAPSLVQAKLSMGELLCHPLCLGFFMARFLTDSMAYFISFWLPDYLSHSRGFSLATIGLVGWLPYLAADLGGPGGGAASDWLVRRGWRPIKARTSLMLIAACLMPLANVAVRTDVVWLAVGLISVMYAAQTCWMANQLALISETVSPENVATLLSLVRPGRRPRRDHRQPPHRPGGGHGRLRAGVHDAWVPAFDRLRNSFAVHAPCVRGETAERRLPSILTRRKRPHLQTCFASFLPPSSRAKPSPPPIVPPPGVSNPSGAASTRPEWFSSQIRHGIGYTHHQFRDYFTPADFEFLHAHGFTHVRLPFEPEIFFDPGAPTVLKPEFLPDFDEQIARILSADLNLVLDPQARNETKQRMKSDANFAAAYAEWWRQFARHLARTDPDRVLLEVINEPQLPAASWSGLQASIAAAMRAGAPRHTLVLTGANWSTVADLCALTPVADSNVVYTFHYYEPEIYTQQGAPWWGKGMTYVKDLHYPVDPKNQAAVIARIPPEYGGFVRLVSEYAGTRAHTAEEIAKAVAWGRRNQAVVWCGEFGVDRRSPAESRMRWLEDVRRVLEEDHLGWTMWDYVGDCRLVEDPAHKAIAPAMARALGIAPE